MCNFYLCLVAGQTSLGLAPPDALYGINLIIAILRRALHIHDYVKAYWFHWQFLFQYISFHRQPPARRLSLSPTQTSAPYFYTVPTNRIRLPERSSAIIYSAISMG